MHRRPLGRGRTLAIIGAVLAIAGCLLPWWRAGGSDGLPALMGNGFASSGVLVFLAAAATLALVTLPYASERPVGIERTLSYLLIAGLAWIGFLFRVGQIFVAGDLGLPDQAPGLWLTLAALVVHARGVFEIAHEPARRY